MSQHALVVPRHGGPEVLQVRDHTTRDPGPDEVVVAVAAAGVNFIDVYQREGAYSREVPFVLGLEGAGQVLTVGTSVAGAGEIAVGDRVAWAMQPGSMASTLTLPAAALVPVPHGLSDEHAAAVMLQGMTAHYLVTDTYPVRRDDVVLVHAAAGGVGQLLVQLVVARGGRVIATAGSPDKCAKARSLGAEHTIDYSSSTDIARQVRDLTGGAGVAAVFDGVGASTVDASLASLAPRGMLVVYGAASGPVPPLDLQRLNAAGSVFVTRPSLAHYIATRPELLTRGGAVLAEVAAGRLSVEIGGTWALTDAVEAYRALEGRRSTGKLLLTP